MKTKNIPGFTINPEDYDFLWKVHNFSFLSVSIWLHVHFKEIDCITTYKDNIHKFYIAKKARQKLGTAGLKLIEKGMPDFKKELGVLMKEALVYIPKIEDQDLKKLSNKQLASEFAIFVGFTQKILSQYFYTEYFNFDKVQEKADKLGINNDSYLRSSPKETTLSKEKYERALLVLGPKKDKIKQHVERYRFILYNIGGKTLTEKNFSALLKEMKDPRKVISETESLHAQVIVARKHHPLAEAIREMAELKFVLRCFVNKTIFTQNGLMSKFIKEITKRIGIKNIEDYHFKEIIHFINIKKSEIKKIDRSSFAYGKFNGWNPIVGKDATRIAEAFDRIDNKDVTEFKGMIGNKGHYIGKVRIVPFDTSIDLSPIIAKMEKGEVLVTGSTGPEMIKACHKAGAIVTDEGGICSHAAIVSRELGIPSVIATKIATEVLKDGDLVEVDANNGIVKKLK